jgi:DNA adenine methylase
VLKRYDSPETLFYCDPPYVGLPYYRHNLKDSDHRDLAGMLAKLRGTFVLSYNDHPLIRKLYDWAEVVPLEVSYRIRCRNAKAGRELLISSPSKRCAKNPG